LFCSFVKFNYRTHWQHLITTGKKCVDGYILHRVRLTLLACCSTLNIWIWIHNQYVATYIPFEFQETIIILHCVSTIDCPRVGPGQTSAKFAGPGPGPALARSRRSRPGPGQVWPWPSSQKKKTYIKKQ
jgi:hypothetical protein